MKTKEFEKEVKPVEIFKQDEKFVVDDLNKLTYYDMSFMGIVRGFTRDGGFKASIESDNWLLNDENWSRLINALNNGYKLEEEKVYLIQLAPNENNAFVNCLTSTGDYFISGSSTFTSYKTHFKKSEREPIEEWLGYPIHESCWKEVKSND